MNLACHIFKKDARLMRAPLAAWVGMQLVLFAIAGLISFPAVMEAGPGWEDWAGGAHILFMAIMWMSAYFFAAIPVHDDAMAGFDALWLTRPVSRWQLLAAKLLGLSVFFCLMPVLVRLPWWLAHGLGAREVGLAAMETVQTSIPIVTLALALASATSSAGQFYRWTLGAVGGMAAMILLLIATQSGNAAVTHLFYRASSWSDTAAIVTAPFVLIAAAQFLFPNPTRTALLMIAFVLSGTFFGTIPVAPYAPLIRTDMEATLSGINGSTGKIRITLKSEGAQNFVTLKQAELYSGAKDVGGVFVEGDVNSLVEAIGSFLRSTESQRPTATYGLFASRQNERIDAKEAWLDAEGAIWQVEYALSVPLVEGGEVAAGSRRLKIERLVPGQTGTNDNPTPMEARGRLVLHETMPVLATEEKFRPEFLSEFYLLVAPLGQIRIMPDAVSTLVSSNIGIRTAIFPFDEIESGLVADQDATRAKPVRLVKIGVRRLGLFHEKIPVTPAGAHP